MIEKAQEIVANSALSQEDKQMWFVHFEGAPQEALELFIELFDNDQTELPLATNSLRKKIAAGNDIERIKSIVHEERQMIQDTINEDKVREKI